VFRDLVRNAQRALEEDAATADPRVTIAVRPRGEFVEVDVRDNGPGVSKDIETRMFEPFVSKYKSSGLGLAISRDLVELHEGQISYRRLDPGACFTVQLRRSVEGDRMGTVDHVGGA
jgi:signal transduction histidine kinase